MIFRRLAIEAARAAAHLRADLGIGPADAVDPLDLAERLGVVVRLAPAPSLEGMYSPEGPTIILSAERPAGRRRHTCAHEIGHHVFGHGLRLDELVEDAGKAGWQPEEFMANRFAVGLLMPKLAVESAITRRGWNAATLTAEHAFVVAQDLGVSYGNFVSHLERTLGILDTAHAQQLRRASKRLPHLRASIAGFRVAHDLVVADREWGARPIDVEVDDVVLVSDGVAPQGECVELVYKPVPHLRAVAAGQGAVGIGANPKPATIRVSRRNFAGLARYRHLEDPDDAF